MKIGNVRKFVVAVVGFLAVVLGPAGIGALQGEELLVGQETAVQAILGLLTAIGVYSARNDPADE